MTSSTSDRAPVAAADEHQPARGRVVQLIESCACSLRLVGMDGAAVELPESRVRLLHHR